MTPLQKYSSCLRGISVISSFLPCFSGSSSSTTCSSASTHCLSRNTELNWSCIMHQPPLHYHLQHRQHIFLSTWKILFSFKQEIKTSFGTFDILKTYVLFFFFFQRAKSPTSCQGVRQHGHNLKRNLRSQTVGEVCLLRQKLD